MLDKSFRMEGFFSWESCFAENSLKAAVITSASRPLKNTRYRGGCVLLSLGVIGEYIAKIYIEVKDRPRYNVEQQLFHDDTPAKRQNSATFAKHS